MDSGEGIFRGECRCKTENCQLNSAENTKACSSEESSKTYNGETKRLGYLSWDEYFMSVACLAAQRSKDPVTQVGAVIVNQDLKIVGAGYNGMPNGCSDDVMPWGKNSANLLETKYPFVCHAEMNAILNKNAESVKGSSIFTTRFPCNECAKIIIQAGIKEVVFKGASKLNPNKMEVVAARRMFSLAKVHCRELQSSRKIYIDLGDESFASTMNNNGAHVATDEV